MNLFVRENYFGRNLKTKVLRRESSSFVVMQNMDGNSLVQTRKNESASVPSNERGVKGQPQRGFTVDNVSLTGGETDRFDNSRGAGIFGLGPPAETDGGAWKLSMVNEEVNERTQGDLNNPSLFTVNPKPESWHKYNLFSTIPGGNSRDATHSPNIKDSSKKIVALNGEDAPTLHQKPDPRPDDEVLGNSNEQDFRLTRMVGPPQINLTPEKPGMPNGYREKLELGAKRYFEKYPSVKNASTGIKGQNVQLTEAAMISRMNKTGVKKKIHRGSPKDAMGNTSIGQFGKKDTRKREMLTKDNFGVGVDAQRKLNRKDLTAVYRENSMKCVQGRVVRREASSVELRFENTIGASTERHPWGNYELGIENDDIDLAPQKPDSDQYLKCGFGTGELPPRNRGGLRLASEARRDSLRLNLDIVNAPMNRQKGLAQMSEDNRIGGRSQRLPKLYGYCPGILADKNLEMSYTLRAGIKNAKILYNFNKTVIPYGPQQDSHGNVFHQNKAPNHQDNFKQSLRGFGDGLGITKEKRPRKYLRKYKNKFGKDYIDRGNERFYLVNNQRVRCNHSNHKRAGGPVPVGNGPADEKIISRPVIDDNHNNHNHRPPKAGTHRRPPARSHENSQGSSESRKFFSWKGPGKSSSGRQVDSSFDTNIGLPSKSYSRGSSKVKYEKDEILDSGQLDFQCSPDVFPHDSDRKSRKWKGGPMQITSITREKTGFKNGGMGLGVSSSGRAIKRIELEFGEEGQKDDQRQKLKKQYIEHRHYQQGENMALFRGCNNKWSESVSNGKCIFRNYQRPLKGRKKNSENSSSVIHHSP
jgi:hypothetical protein